jgi:phosphopantothenoylcysteine decarboxylase/phosphopantothenate--cysteine ligase
VGGFLFIRPRARLARAKLLKKGLPLVVGNLGPATFGRDDNALLLVDAQGDTPLPADGGRADKLTLARALVAEIARRMKQAGGRP